MREIKRRMWQSGESKPSSGSRGHGRERKDEMEGHAERETGLAAFPIGPQSYKQREHQVGRQIHKERERERERERAVDCVRDIRSTRLV